MLPPGIYLFISFMTISLWYSMLLIISYGTLATFFTPAVYFERRFMAKTVRSRAPPARISQGSDRKERHYEEIFAECPAHPGHISPYWRAGVFCPASPGDLSLHRPFRFHGAGDSRRGTGVYRYQEPGTFPGRCDHLPVKGRTGDPPGCGEKGQLLDHPGRRQQRAGSGAGGTGTDSGDRAVFPALCGVSVCRPSESPPSPADSDHDCAFVSPGFPGKDTRV